MQDAKAPASSVAAETRSAAPCAATAVVAEASPVDVAEQKQRVLEAFLLGLQAPAPSTPDSPSLEAGELPSPLVSPGTTLSAAGGPGLADPKQDEAHRDSGVDSATGVEGVAQGDGGSPAGACSASPRSQLVRSFMNELELVEGTGGSSPRGTGSAGHPGGTPAILGYGGQGQAAPTKDMEYWRRQTEALEADLAADSGSEARW